MGDRTRVRPSLQKRVGFLLASLHTGVAPQFWLPLTELAAKTGVDLFVFPGGRLAAPDPEEKARGRLYSLVGPRNLDGALTWASSLGGFIGPAELDAFHEGFAAIPLVAMAHKLPGRPSIRIDVYSGMRELVSHMTAVHGARRIAFIRGPEEHESAEERLRGFLDAQGAAGVRSDPRLIASPRPWNEGEAAIEELLDRRGLLPGRDFDALLAASDLQLYSAALFLQRRGFAVPGDLLIAGFNDSVESRIFSPSVTTVRLPFGTLAERAFLALLRSFRGERVESEEVLPSELVVRQSCGCISSSVREAGRRYVSSANRVGIDSSDAVSRGAVLRASLLATAAKRRVANEEERTAWIRPLADAFVTSAEGQASDASAAAFPATLERIMERLIRLGRDVGSWQDLLSALRGEALSSFGPSAKDRIEELIGQGRVIVSEAAVRADTARGWKAAVTAQAIRDLERDLIRLDEREKLGEVLSGNLPSLGIAAAYVAEEDQEGRRARLIAGYDARGILLPEALSEYDAAELLPPGILPRPSGATWIVEPLCAGDGYFGRLIVSLGVRESSVYEELRGALSSALQGLISIDEIRNARRRAEKAEELKSRFLASVSADLRAPLEGIIAGADEALGAEAEAEPREGPIASALASIRSAAARQLTLTDDLLDLARCETGELQLDSALVRPEHLIARAQAVAEFPAEYPGVPRPLPLLRGDSDRLARILALLFDRARPAELAVAVEACFLAFAVRRKDGNAAAPEDEGGLGRSIAFARRLVSAHLGRLESIEEDGVRFGWTMRLPYPTLGGGVAAAPPPGPARLAVLTEGGAYPYDLPFVIVPDIPSVDAGISALAFWATKGTSAKDARLLRRIAENHALATLPFLYFPEADAEVAASDLGQLISPSSCRAEESSWAICDDEWEWGSALAARLSGHGTAAPLVADSPETLSRMGQRPSVVVARLRSGRPGPGLRFSAPQEPRPTIVYLWDPLEGDVDLAGIELDQRTILLHEGVLSHPELGRFLRGIASGRRPLPPHTGAIVKRAQRFMHLRFRNELSRWRIAEAVAVSEDYLGRIFRRELAMAPWEYLIRLRVQAARRTLRDTAMSVREVAEATGFHDQAYFCRVFKNIEGSTPRAFRARQTDQIIR